MDTKPMRRTKIICTIGPASRSVSKLKQLIHTGMDVARINFSHGTWEEHGEVISRIRKVSQEMDKPIAILGDLQGPKIRVGKIAGDKIVLKKGHLLELTTRNVLGNENLIPTDFKNLCKEVTPGEIILLNEGMIRLQVLSLTQNSVHCKVVEGGLLLSRKGINLPGIPVDIPSLTEKDKKDLEFCMHSKVDYIALSFVRRAEDIINIKRIINKAKADIPVIAKLEKPQAIENLDAILEVTDGVMVARGDLGVEMSIADVPVIQKDIIRRANQKRIPVITATQMLETMTENPRPTRAEASDVANAIFDGTDAVMLSGETATGKYPVETVAMMVQIINSAEAHLKEHPVIRRRAQETKIPFEDAISDSASFVANAIHAQVIVAFTQSGDTARLISKCRTQTPVVAFTPHENIRHRMNLYWGVTPYVMPLIESVDEVIEIVVDALRKRKLVKRGDNIVIIMGAPIYHKGTTNLLKLHCIS